MAGKSRQFRQLSGSRSLDSLPPVHPIPVIPLVTTSRLERFRKILAASETEVEGDTGKLETAVIVVGVFPDRQLFL